MNKLHFLNKKSLILPVIFIIAFTIRLLYVTFFCIHVPHGDGVSYDSLSSLISYKPPFFLPEYDIRRAPFYPLFLSVIFSLFGHSPFVVLVIQAFVSSLMTLLLFYYARLMTNYRTALLTAVITAFYPIFIYYSGQILTETLFLSLFFLSMCLFEYSKNNKSLYSFIFFSIVFTFSIYTRPIAILFIPAFLISDFLCKTFNRETLKQYVVIFAVMCVIASPWVYRNFSVLNHFIPLTTEGGVTFYFSNNIYSDGSGVYRPTVYQKYKDEIESISKDYPNPIIRQKVLYKRGVDFIKSNPKHYLTLMGDKFLWFWKVLPNTTIRDKILSAFSYGLLLPFFIFIFLKNFTSKKRVFLTINLFIIIVTIFHCTFAYGSTRFRLVLEPFIILLASIGIQNLFNKIMSLKKQ
jgi:4-amino-4-deoxy-L-arabinose transferase-like glycosyltransferase